MFLKLSGPDGRPTNDVLGVAEALNYISMYMHEINRGAGWWDKGASDPEVIATKLALIHSEISEALEGYRKGEMDAHLPTREAFEVELADAVIRILDLASSQGFYIGDAIVEKLAYNRNRPDHTPEARAAKHGKKF